MERDDYSPAMLSHIKQILTRPNIDLRIAASEKDDLTVLGWVCTEGEVLHYIYVRKDLRGNGIARDLVGERTIRQYSHKSPRARAWLAAGKPSPANAWAFNPFLGHT